MDGKRVKILDGIAGSGKTSRAVALLQDAGVDYLHTTSTNRLRRDITLRFGREAKTVASGLFTTGDGGVFYAAPKEPEEDVVIVDEVLQTSQKVLDWIGHTSKRVIVCTDSKQMLAPKTGATMAQAFDAFCKSGIADVYTYDYSYRPLTSDTRAIFDRAYREDPDGSDLWKWCKNNLSIKDFDKKDYEEDSVYLCHTNDVEADLYTRWSLRDRYDIQGLIPKGTISAKVPKDLRRYPITPQDETTAQYSAYLQVPNIASVVRYQGSEVAQGQSLYYLVKPDAAPRNRELYTMLTRCRDISSLAVYRYNVDADVPIYSYLDKPIIKEAVYCLSEHHDIMLDGKSVYHKKEMTALDTIRALEVAQADERKVKYTGFVKDGKEVVPVDEPAHIKLAGGKISMSSIVRREPRLLLGTPGRFLTECEKAGYYPQVPYCFLVDGKSRTGEHYKYGLDIRAAYPSYWHIGGMLDCKSYRPDETGERQIYMVTGGRYLRQGDIILDTAAEYISEHSKLGDFKVQCIGSADMIHDDRVGQMIYDKAYKSAEDKAELKGIHWGLLERPYLKPGKWTFTGGYDFYTIDDHARGRLAMAALHSEMILTTAKLRMRLFGSLDKGEQRVDCVYFDTDEDIELLGVEIWQTVIPGYDFRIFADVPTFSKTAQKPVLFKTYEDLPTREELRRKVARERQRQKRAAEH